MHIQWFPGHMTKSMRMIKENLPIVDAVIYVLDSRAPFSCINPEFDKMTDGKKLVYVLNKSDLADPKATALWEKYFNQKGAAVSVDATRYNSAAIITGALSRSLEEKIERQRKRGLTMPLKVMVLGIPNSGKSTIINTLCKSKRAKTGNKPGVTRGKQWLKAGDFGILDTPGTLWNAFADQTAARRLAYIGSINDDILDIEQLAAYFLQDIIKIYPGKVKARYKVDEALPPHQLIEKIGGQRGYIIKGGVDNLRSANAILDDFRKGRLGRITLELPNFTD